jgi:hypothetical protein
LGAMVDGHYGALHSVRGHSASRQLDRESDAGLILSSKLRTLSQQVRPSAAPPSRADEPVSIARKSR